MNKFQVGDHVKGNKGYAYENLIDARVIAIVDDLQIAIRCLRYLDGDTKNVRKDVIVDSEYFDFADLWAHTNDSKSKGNIITINGQPYTNEEFVKDAERFVRAFPDRKSVSMSGALEDILIVHQWAQENPPVSNIDHYADEIGWDEEQKESVRRLGTPLPNFYSQPFDKVGKEWWDQEYKPKKHFTSSKQN